MILTSRKKIIKYLFSVLAVFVFVGFNVAQAQESLTLSISPSLFDMSVNPGQEWRSTLKIINVNNYDLTVYIDVVNFRPQGEGGDGRFIPIATDGEGVTLAEWFTITKEAILIPKEQSKEIPFSVSVPDNASPGGHFAAILVGTKPLSSESGQAKVQTAQAVTSLFFARVAGNIVEQGSIREFTTTDSYLNRPEATFGLRFENKGNVHLQPQGEIKIFNMWGQERGVIPINQTSQFGNVLPDSIRNFTFSWKGEWSISDIGRYTALVSLAYGTEARQFVTAETSFWVIPFKLLFSILGFILLSIFIITKLVKIYIRHTLQLAGINLDQQTNFGHSAPLNLRTQAKRKLNLHAPIKSSLLDLKTGLKLSSAKFEKFKVLCKFVIHYRLFFGGLFLILILLGIVLWFVLSANTAHRGFEISYVNPDESITLTSEEIIFNQLKKERQLNEPEINSQLPQIAVINRSGIPGIGAEIRLRLEAMGYEVITLGADFSNIQKRSVIIYNDKNESEALRLSSRLNNAPVSKYPTEKEQDYLTVYVGSDLPTD